MERKQVEVTVVCLECGKDQETRLVNGNWIYEKILMNLGRCEEFTICPDCLNILRNSKRGLAAYKKTIKTEALYI